MWANALARTINGLNPTSHGRKWLAWQSERLGRPAGGACRVMRSVRMRIDARDATERLIYYHAFEREELDVVRARLRPGNVFLDLGANVGLFTLVARRSVGTGGLVIAVEPNPRVRARLESNIALNGRQGVVVLPIAAGDVRGELDFYLPAEDTSHAVGSLRPQRGADGRGNVVRVQVEPLDDVLPAHLTGADGKTRRVDFVKMDIEGAELPALRGMANLIRRDRPRMLVELNYSTTTAFGYHASEIARFLLDLHPDYRLSHVGAHRLEPVDIATLTRDRPFGNEVANVLFE